MTPVVCHHVLFSACHRVSGDFHKSAAPTCMHTQQGVDAYHFTLLLDHHKNGVTATRSAIPIWEMLRGAMWPTAERCLSMVNA